MDDPRTFEQGFDQITSELKALLVRKQHDYGYQNIMNSPFGPEKGLLVRLFDKISRLANLTKRNDNSPTTPNFESIEDSWLDTANYSIIALMVRRGYFTLPLEDADRGERISTED